jgi:hypothetical protein
VFLLITRIETIPQPSSAIVPFQRSPLECQIRRCEWMHTLQCPVKLEWHILIFMAGFLATALFCVFIFLLLSPSRPGSTFCCRRRFGLIVPDITLHFFNIPSWPLRSRLLVPVDGDTGSPSPRPDLSQLRQPEGFSPIHNVCQGCRISMSDSH